MYKKLTVEVLTRQPIQFEHLLTVYKARMAIQNQTYNLQHGDVASGFHLLCGRVNDNPHLHHRTTLSTELEMRNRTKNNIVTVTLTHYFPGLAH